MELCRNSQLIALATQTKKSEFTPEWVLRKLNGGTDVDLCSITSQYLKLLGLGEENNTVLVRHTV